MRLAIFLLLALMFLSSCTTPGAVSGTPSMATIENDAGYPEDRAPAYRLGSGDQVRIIVFNEDSLSGEFVVDGEGAVSMPLIGEVDAEGLTLQELRSTIETRLSEGYLTDPRVSAEVLNYRPFYILGEVESSGEYPYTDGLTVMNAVARAGGFTYRANTRRVFIQRADAEGEEEVTLTPTLRVNPGDTIRIIERLF